MKIPIHHIPKPSIRTRQSGAAAIELAILLPILLICLTVPVFYARCFWYYTVAQKAAQDAARYLAFVPKATMAVPAQAQAAGNLATEIVNRELAELTLGPDFPGPAVTCTNPSGSSTKPCGFLVPAATLPGSVTVSISFPMSDPIFDIPLWGDVVITSDVTMRYVGI